MHNFEGKYIQKFQTTTIILNHAKVNTSIKLFSANVKYWILHNYIKHNIVYIHDI